MLIKLTTLVFFQLLFTICILFISKRYKFLDYPSDRKKHLFPVPYTGGIVISFNYLFIVFIFDFESIYFNLILTYSLLICLAGFLDDKLQLNPITKLILQVFPIIYLIEQDIFLTNLGSYHNFGILELGTLAKLFTLFSCLFLVNAFNYSDGLDGLLGSISIIIIASFFIFLLYYKSIINLDFLTILIPIFLFLFFNLTNNKSFKLFLGDSGSNLLGFIISFISILLYLEFDLHPAIIVWPLAYIVYEFLTVNILRIIRSKKIFQPSNDHFHYELGKFLKLNNYIVVTIIIFINIFFASFGIMVKFFLSYEISLLLFVLLFLIYFAIRLKIQKKLINHRLL